MRWRGRKGSSNVEDRRHQSGGRKAGFALGGGFTTIIIALVAYFVFGVNPMNFLGGGGQVGGGGGGGAAVADPDRDKFEAPLAKFSNVVLKDTEDVWTPIFQSEFGKRYNPPKMVLYRDGTQTGCGYGQSASGPFYCPGDQRVYLDLTFFALLQKKFKAQGDFAMAYVIAHEVAHHVQNELGLSMRIQDLQRRASKVESNQLSVRLELQADYLAGVWVNRIEKQKQILEGGDLQEALNAAKRIGDDTLQREATGRVTPDGFTHGTAEQRARWLRRGIESGSVADADLMAPFDTPYDQL